MPRSPRSVLRAGDRRRQRAVVRVLFERRLKPRRDAVVICMSAAGEAKGVRVPRLRRLRCGSLRKLLRGGIVFAFPVKIRFGDRLVVVARRRGARLPRRRGAFFPFAFPAERFEQGGKVLGRVAASAEGDRLRLSLYEAQECRKAVRDGRGVLRAQLSVSL